MQDRSANARLLGLVLLALVGTVSCGGSTPAASTRPAPTFLSSCVASSARDQIAHPSGSARYETLNVNNLLRDYRVFRPATLDNTKPAPLVIMLHGSPIDADALENVIHFDAQASAAGFLSVSPDGCDMDWDQTHGSVDVVFISHMIDRLESEFSIDRSRVYVVGVSAGGFMTYRLACDLANRIAAVASVAGSMWWNDCQPARPISVLEMHGTVDANVPYDGGRATYRGGMSMPPVVTVIQRWVALDGCTVDPVSSQTGITKTSLWNRCGGGSVVRLDTVIGGHHTWFGSTLDAVPGEPNANSAVWDFLKQFQLAS